MEKYSIKMILFVFNHFDQFVALNAAKYRQFSGTVKQMQQSQQPISFFRRSEVTFTPGFKSLPKLVRLTPPRARTGKNPTVPK